MYFDMKNYLKNNHNHTVKHTLHHFILFIIICSWGYDPSYIFVKPEFLNLINGRDLHHIHGYLFINIIKKCI